MIGELTQNIRYARYKKYYLGVTKILRQEKAQKSLSLILSLFLIAILIAFALKPSLKKIIEIKKDIDNLNKISQQLAKKQNSLQAANLKWPRLEKAAGQMREMIPQGPKELDFLQEVEELANKTGVEYQGGALEEVSFIKEGEKNIYEGDNLVVIGGNFNLRLRGDYVNLEEFIRQFRRGKRLISLEIINFTKRKDENKQNKIEVNLKGQVYYLGSKQLQQTKNKLKQQ